MISKVIGKSSPHKVNKIKIRPQAARFQAIYTSDSNLHVVFSTPHSVIDVAGSGKEVFKQKN